jgi:hypothetical protein
MTRRGEPEPTLRIKLPKASSSHPGSLSRSLSVAKCSYPVGASSATQRASREPSGSDPDSAWAACNGTRQAKPEASAREKSRDGSGGDQCIDWWGIVADAVPGAHARDALAGDEFQWASELAELVLAVNGANVDAKRIKALALTKLGERQINATARNYYLTSALYLLRDLPPE